MDKGRSSLLVYSEDVGMLSLPMPGLRGWRVYHPKYKLHEKKLMLLVRELRRLLSNLVRHDWGIGEWVIS